MNKCTICLTESLDKIIFLKECNHPFCKECITEWIRSGKITCPNCRAEISKEDYSECEIPYRSKVLQELIDDTINYHSEELEFLDEEYNELVLFLNYEDTISEYSIKIKKEALEYLLKQHETIIKNDQKKINNKIRKTTQDDLSVVLNLSDEQIHYFHNKILDNLKKIKIINECSKEHIINITNQIDYNRTERKRKREYNEKVYSQRKELIQDHIKFLKET